MRQDRKTEIKVGISLLVSLVILLWVIAWAKNVDIFSDKKELTISFNSVAGLTAGDQVAVNGVKKGYVESITLDGNTVLVNTILDEDVDIRSDATFSILMLDLMGGKKIEISPGISEQQIDYSVVQHGQFSGDISTAMATLSGMEQNIKNIIEELKKNGEVKRDFWTGLSIHSIDKVIAKYYNLS
ncbi:MAG TPA: MCE family protein, partial [Ignavibacteria bacterium]|nr:MCE family protein [Ignavibacteria bacterium]